MLAFHPAGQLSGEEHVGQLALLVAGHGAVGPLGEEHVVKVDLSCQETPELVSD